MSDETEAKDEVATTKGDDKPPVEAKKPDLAIASSSLANKKWVIFLVVGFLSLFADQATKIWAREALPTQVIHGNDPRACDPVEDLKTHRCQGVDVPVFGKFWSHRLSMNPGSAFGLFSGQNSARIFLSIVGIIAVGGMVWMLKKARSDQRVLHWALAFVAGGAVGNLIDRIGFGVVTDMVLWRYDTHEWPVFNVSDIVLVIGVGLMFIDIQKEGKREKAERRKKLEGSGLVKDHRA
ncbi:MAG: signal peptidase II [Proteobacteria bacterium]|nr:signal peptidase II [Pseudomonadota bacterium]